MINQKYPTKPSKKPKPGSITRARDYLPRQSILLLNPNFFRLSNSEVIPTSLLQFNLLHPWLAIGNRITTAMVRVTVRLSRKRWVSVLLSFNATSFSLVNFVLGFYVKVILSDWWLIKCSNEFEGKRFGVSGTEIAASVE